MHAIKPVVWGVLGTARIGLDKVPPATQRSPLIDLRGIASRTLAAAAAAAAARAGKHVLCEKPIALTADEARALQAVFSYFNDDPANIRNQRDTGGGALYDIGCYAVVAARHVFAAEPLRAVETLPEADQYQRMAEDFSRNVRGEPAPFWGVEDAISQMAVIDALWRSERSNAWETVQGRTT